MEESPRLRATHHVEGPISRMIMSRDGQLLGLLREGFLDVVSASTFATVATLPLSEQGKWASTDAPGFDFEQTACFLLRLALGRSPPPPWPNPITCLCVGVSAPTTKPDYLSVPLVSVCSSPPAGLVVRRLTFIDRLDSEGNPVSPPQFDVGVLYDHVNSVAEWRIPYPAA